MAAIIFDFDGTIADSFETVVRVAGEMTSRGKGVLSSAEVERLRGLSLHQAAQELGVKPWRIPFLMIRGRRRLSVLIPSIKSQPGVPEVVRKLYTEGHQLFMLSSNSERNIQQFLKQHHMSKEFVKIYGGAGLLNKARLIRKIRRQNRLAGDDCWYIGDEVRDIVSAKEAGVKVIAVTWGFNKAELLRTHEPTALADTPAQLLSILENI